MCINKKFKIVMMSLLTNSFIAKYAPSLVIGIKDVVAALLQASELTE